MLPTSHFGVASVGGRAWVLGGYPVERSAMFEVDLERGRAERRDPPPGFAPGDHFHFLAWLRGELHVVFDAAKGQWRTAAPLPFPVVMPAVVARAGSIWIVGGERLDNTPIGIVEYEIAEDRSLAVLTDDVEEVEAGIQHQVVDRHSLVRGEAGDRQ